MSRYAKHAGMKRTPQSEKIPGTDQAENSAGGFVYAVDMWKRLERFLILGSEGGTYYVGERKLTIDNAANLMKCLAEDGLRTVSTIVEISESGRAPKNDPAIFALAVAAKKGDPATRHAAFTLMSRVCRTGTHLFSFIEATEAFGGWGRGQRRAVGQWYTGKDPEKLAYQLVKYRQRNGWTHRDVLRLAKPAAGDNPLLKFAVGKAPSELPPLIADFMRIQSATKAGEVISVLKANPNLPWETIPSQFLGESSVWEALLPYLPMTALIRNLGRMTANGLICPLSAASKQVVTRLSDTVRLRTARVHPLQVLMALTTYAAGHGVKGSLGWTPVPQVKDALNDAFYASFSNVEPTGKNFYLGIDVSGSMGWGTVAGSHLTPAQAAAAMAMVVARTETNYTMFGFADRMRDLGISAGMSLETVLEKTSDLSFGRTDCAQPMRHALKSKLDVDVFTVLTDNETWHGRIHPSQALNDYRTKTGRAAKQVVVGMTATDFTIADPNDAGTLDVVGLDTSVPQIIADFAKQ